MRWLKKLRERKKTARNSDPIKHVVVLMFENHSFDQMLGCFKSIYPEMEGVDPNAPRHNLDSTGRKYYQAQSNFTTVSLDPKHELENILNHLEDQNGGFVSEYERTYPKTSTDQRQRIMDYFGMGDLPVLHQLANDFTICDHWFSSVPGPTWTNRFFVHSGTSKGSVTMPEGFWDAVRKAQLLLYFDQDTIFDRLNDKRISWRVYCGDVPQSLALRHQRAPKNVMNYRFMPSFYDDAQGSERAFPAYAFIEPNYFKGEQNDDHPSHSTMRAQRLLAKVYNALRSNEDLWNSTLLVVLHDEHGGFYDHVEPPTAVVPDQHQEEYSFDRLGVRVPALLISPWVDRNFITTQFDHTSLLKYLSDKWKLDPLSERARSANSLADAIRRDGQPREDTPSSIEVPPLRKVMRATALPTGAGEDMTDEELAEPINDLQRSLMLLAEHLGQQEQPAASQPKMMMAGPLAEEQLASERTQAFLKYQSEQARNQHQ